MALVKLSSPEARAGAQELSRALILFLVAFVLAAFLRFPDRAARPMHVDETTQSVKLQELMSGHYKYDPLEHHGPTLLYATLPIKWFSSAKSWAELTESQLRLVPVLFGIGLLLLLVVVGDGFSPSELAWGAMAVAVSPLMVFYSRYYIMEMLLVFFTFGLIGCGWRFYLTRKTGWLVMAGGFAGLMHATKETFVLQFAGILVGLFGVWLTDLFSAGSGMGLVNRARKNPVRQAQLLAFVLAAAASSVLIFSKFFTAPGSVVDSVATYGKYLKRAEGQGHEKPFYYYADLIWGGAMSPGPAPRPAGDGNAPSAEAPAPAARATESSNPFSALYWKLLPEKLGITPTGRIVWGERFLLILAGLGMIAAFVTKPARNQSRHLVRFLAIYSPAVFLLYSAVAYKTPWCILGAWHGMLLMAGLGAASLMRLFSGKVGRSVMWVLLMAGMAHAALLSYRATRGQPSFAAAVRNPLNYSMTSPDCLDWVAKIYRFSEISGKGDQFSIVQADAQGGWPLPWYLRRFPNYVWQGGDLGLMEKADLILSSASFRENLPSTVCTPAGSSDGTPGWVEFKVKLHTTGSIALFVRRPIWEAYLAKAANAPWPELPVQL